MKSGHCVGHKHRHLRRHEMGGSLPKDEPCCLADSAPGQGHGSTCPDRHCCTPGHPTALALLLLPQHQPHQAQDTQQCAGGEGCATRAPSLSLQATLSQADQPCPLPQRCCTQLLAPGILPCSPLPACLARPTRRVRGSMQTSVITRRDSAGEARARSARCTHKTSHSGVSGALGSATRLLLQVRAAAAQEVASASRAVQPGPAGGPCPAQAAGVALPAAVLRVANTNNAGPRVLERKSCASPPPRQRSREAPLCWVSTEVPASTAPVQQAAQPRPPLPPPLGPRSARGSCWPSPHPKPRPR